MAVDGFLTVPDIPGESQRRGHEDEIEVHGVSFAMATSGASGGGPRRGRTQLGPLTIAKDYDKSSPYLAKAFYDNERWDEVVLSVVRVADGDTRDYLVVRLVDASVMSYSFADADDADRLEERLTLSYRTIRFTYDGDHEVELEASPGR
jgi:type VI secretion system secreted protein Hcp